MRTIPLVLGLLTLAPATQAQEWWGWRSPQKHPVPAAGGSEAGHPIDEFVEARRRDSGLSAAPRADRRTLIRRAYYDLTGLPPTPERVAAFVANQSPDAWERLIDELLASPQYGVKWGRHWLDVVRFAETDSYERDRLKPGAWRYRDWVVDAFNTDKPYDQFITEQLAGDELPNPSFEDIVATGYYRLGIWDDEPTDVLQAQFDDLDSIADTTARAFLAVSMGCARCHDHKKDPLPTKDYYRFLATFEGIKPYKNGPGNSTTAGNFLKRIPLQLGRSDFPARLEEWTRRRTALEQEVRNLGNEVVERFGDDEPVGASLRQGRVVHFDLEAEGDLQWNRGKVVGDDDTHGNALRLDGGNNAGALIDRPVADDFTLSIWFKTERPQRGNPRDLRWFLGAGLIDGEVPGIVNDFGLSMVADHVTAGVGRPETFVSSPGGLADGNWHHTALTRVRDTGQVALYVDGVLVAEAKGGRQALDRPAKLAIGHMLPGHGGFRGALDDVRIYDRALSPREILALHGGAGFEPEMADAIERRLGKPEAARYRSAVEQLTTLRRPIEEKAQVLCVQEFGTAVKPSFVRVRGNANAKGPQVASGIPALFGGADLKAFAPKSKESSGRRLALARWLTTDGALYSARVMANRMWQHHFGRGIARNPNDFGILGVKPTHPRLLDWLAHKFVERDWSIKAMHRLIMTSETYRMGYRSDDAAMTRDPLNDLMWRFDMRRLTAEEIRDSVLAVTGELNLQISGPGIYPPMPAEVLATSSRPGQAWGRSSPEQAARRSLFIHVKRSLLHPLLLAFDLADTDASCPVRFATTQPTQALTLMNGEFSDRRAVALKARLKREATELQGRVKRGLELVYQRPPSKREIRTGMSLIERLRQDQGLDEDAALRHFCLLLLNLNEFLFVD